jgi:hypothetical protein
LTNIDEAVLITIDERPQEHASNQSEDGGVGSDAEGEREHYRDGQPLRAGQGTNRELQVV